MNQTKRISALTLDDLEASHADLLSIGELSEPPGPTRRLAWAEVKAFVRAARMVASLIALLLSRDWDGVFYVTGNNVLLKFGPPDLAASSCQGIENAIPLVETFKLWLEAQATVVTTGSISSNDSAGLGNDDSYSERVRRSQLILETIRNQTQSNGNSIGQCFENWVRKHARSRHIALFISAINGGSVQFTVPPRAMLIARSHVELTQVNADSTDMPSVKIDSICTGIRLTTATGTTFIIRNDLLRQQVNEGDGISFFASNQKREYGWWTQG